MWIYAGLGLAAGVGLVVASSSKEKSLPESPKSPFLRAGDRVLLIGDSLAQGLSVPMKQLASEDQIAFLADGRQGTRIGQWGVEPWLSQDLATFRPTLVLVSLGTNDMRMTDPNGERPALAALLLALRGLRALWIAPPTMPFPDRGVRAMIADTEVPTFHSESLSIPRGPDGIHPTASGFAGFAGSVWKSIRLSAMGAAERMRFTITR